MKPKRSAYLLIFLLTVSAPSSSQAETPPNRNYVAAGNHSPHSDHEKLVGKWIVKSVERDGEPNQAQVGQQVGDVITIEMGDGQRLEFG